MQWSALALLAAAPALAQQAGADAGVSAEAGAAVRGPSAGRRAIVRAQTALMARDYSGALTAYREASNERDTAVEGLLGLGYTAQAQADRDGALSAYRRAVDRANTPSEDLNHGRALQAIATLLEEMAHWDEATAAWNTYVTFAESHASVASAANGRARVEAIRQRAVRAPLDAAVAQRIEARRQANAHGPQN